MIHFSYFKALFNLLNTSLTLTHKFWHYSASVKSFSIWITQIHENSTQRSKTWATSVDPTTDLLIHFDGIMKTKELWCLLYQKLRQRPGACACVVIAFRFFPNLTVCLLLLTVCMPLQCYFVKLPFISLFYVTFDYYLKFQVHLAVHLIKCTLHLVNVVGII